MALSDIVHVSYVSSNPGVTFAGFGTPMIASPNASMFGSDRIRFYADIDEVSEDWGPETPEYRACQAALSQSTGLSLVAVGRCVNKPTQRYEIAVNSAVENGVYNVRIAGPDDDAWVSQEAEFTAEAAAAWVAATAYALNDVVINDSGKMYVAVQAGTSAGSGGPTGTSSAIVDNGVIWDYVGTGAVGDVSQDAILYALKELIDAFAAPTLDITTSLQGSAGSRTLRILANTAGDFFGVEVNDYDLLLLKQDHDDPGIAADLAAISAASKRWYGLITLHNSQALVVAAAAWVEAAKKLYTPASADTRIATDALNVATDVAKALKDASYARTGCFHHPAPDEHADAAQMGRWFPINPGGDNWIMKSLSGVTAKTYSSTHETNMRAKYVNWYAPFTEEVNLVQGKGLVAAFEYIDVIRFRDWYENRLQVNCANLIIQNEKVPYIDDGISKIEAQIRAANAEGIRVGGIANDPEPTIVIPKAATVASADRAARILRGVSSTWRLAGAINEIYITVSGQP